MLPYCMHVTQSFLDVQVGNKNTLRPLSNGGGTGVSGKAQLVLMAHYRCYSGVKSVCLALLLNRFEIGAH